MYDELLAILHNAKKNRIPTILDVDDLIFHSDFIEGFYFLDDNPKKILEYKSLLYNIENTFHNVDYLLGSTPCIASLAEQYGKTSLFFRNCLLQKHLKLYGKLYMNRHMFSKKRIGYFAGSNTHDDDLAYILPVLEDLFERDSEVELLLMGFLEENDFTQKYSRRIIKQPFGSYEDYLNELCSCKVIVAPIAKINNFSNAKSNVKYIEAAAVGVPVISSPTAEMIFSIDHNTTGWLPSTLEEWAQSLDMALSGDFAHYVGECANHHVMKKFVCAEDQFKNVLQAIVESHKDKTK